MDINYSTSFDPNHPEFIEHTADTYEKYKDNTHKNEAEITGDVEYKGEKSIDTDPVKAQQDVGEKAFKNGKKVGTLNKEKREISWEIYVNYMEKNLIKDPKIPFVVTDTLSPGQSFDKTSLVVKEYTVTKEGMVNPNESVIVDEKSYNIAETAEGFTLTFPDGINKRYVIQFKTKINGISEKEYSNTATVTGGKDIDAKVKYPNYNVFLSKKPVEPESEEEIKEGHRVWIDDQVDWQIEINDNLSDIDPGAKIEDTIGSALIYIKNSVRIVDKDDHSLASDKYSVSSTPDGENTKLTITFKERITEKYTVKYSTVVDKTSGEITNSASFNGGEKVEGITKKEVKISIRQSSGGTGSGISSKGSIIINKVDENDDKITAPAEFKIYYKLNGEDKLVGGTTHHTVNGEIKLEGLNFRTYYIEEVTPPNGFEYDPNTKETKTIMVKVERKADSDNTGAYFLPITNTHEKITVTGTKKWVGGPTTRPDIELQLYRNIENGQRVAVEGGKVKLTNGTLNHEWTDLDLTDNAGNEYIYTVDEVKTPVNYTKSLDGLTVTNTYGIPKTQVTGTKEWVHVPDGAIKPTIQLQLYRDGEALGDPVDLVGGTETYTWDNLDLTNEDGKVYIYTVDEVETPENYKKTISSDGLTITNAYSPKTSVTGTKIWDGGLKPAIELQLYRNSIAFEDPVTLDNTISGDAWTHTWIDLYSLDDQGVEYEYTVNEVSKPEGYGQKRSDDKLTITNTYDSPTTDVTGRKKWDGGPRVKPTIELQLYRENSNASIEKVGTPVQLEDGTYEYVWKDLARTDHAGIEYIYTVKEVETPESYVSTEDGLTVTNTYVSPKTEVTGTKEWKGGPFRKPTIKLQLYRNGIALGEAIELEDGSFAYTWTDLDLTDKDGVDYIYTIDEIDVPSRYVKTVLDDGLKILNTYRPPVDPEEPSGGGGGGTPPKPTDPKDPTDPENPTDPKDPTDPDRPIDPTDPTDPDRPIDPEDPTDPDRPTDPEDPTRPTTPTDPPKYKPTETPDPNDPNSPDKFVLVDENGVPRGTYTKVKQPDGTFIYVDEDGIPLGAIDDDGIPAGNMQPVPKTGDDMPVLPLAILFIVSLFSAVGLMIFKKKRYN